MFSMMMGRPKGAPHPLSDKPSNNINGAAGNEWNDHSDGARWIDLRYRNS
jgi:hypothetical protein